MKRVRVTEIGVLQACRLKWEYKYIKKLKRPESAMSAGRMAQGTAIHHGIEVGMLTGADPVEAALAKLEELTGRPERFTTGVRTAIAGVPKSMWQAPRPQVEDFLEVTYYEGNGVIIAGRPDFWLVTPEGDIEITDFKSTSSDEGSRLEAYEVFDWALLYYGVLVHDLLALEGHEPPPIYTRHIVLSTRGKHAIGAPKLLAGRRLTQVREHMVALALEVGTLPIIPTWSPIGCKWCEFADLDILRATGGSVE